MKETSLRELQHHLSDVIRSVEQGQEVVITRRNRVIARLVPDRPRPQEITWPDFAKRARAIIRKPKGAPLSAIVVEERKGRP